MNTAEKWFVLFVLTGKEEKVKHILEQRFENRLRFVVPKRKLRERKNGTWKEVTRVLFPGYLFINGIVTSETYYEMKDVPDIIKLLKTGNEIAEIRPEEMQILGRLISYDEVIGFSQVLCENDKVRVTDGPLTELEGCIVSIDKRKGRAKIMLTLMGELRTVDLGISILEKA
jgi:transcriptional antiterminator NusG